MAFQRSLTWALWDVGVAGRGLGPAQEGLTRQRVVIPTHQPCLGPPTMLGLQACGSGLCSTSGGCPTAQE